MFRRCKHRWKVVSDTILTPGLGPGETIKSAGYTFPLDIERLLAKTHILVLVCERCGKLNKTVTRSKP